MLERYVVKYNWVPNQEYLTNLYLKRSIFIGDAMLFSNEDEAKEACELVFKAAKEDNFELQYAILEIVKIFVYDDSE